MTMAMALQIAYLHGLQQVMFWVWCCSAATVRPSHFHKFPEEILMKVLINATGKYHRQNGQWQAAVYILPISAFFHDVPIVRHGTDDFRAYDMLTVV
jgi:hypothetical protein